MVPRVVGVMGVVVVAGVVGVVCGVVTRLVVCCCVVGGVGSAVTVADGLWPKDELSTAWRTTSLSKSGRGSGCAWYVRSN